MFWDKNLSHAPRMCISYCLKPASELVKSVVPPGPRNSTHDIYVSSMVWFINFSPYLKQHIFGGPRFSIKFSVSQLLGFKTNGSTHENHPNSGKLYLPGYSHHISQVKSQFWRINHLKSPSEVVDHLTGLPDISRAPRPNASGSDPSVRSNAKEVLLVVRDRPPSAGIRSPAVQNPDPERFLQVFSGFFTDKTGNNDGLAKKI